jgi:hypothetical protein
MLLNEFGQQAVDTDDLDHYFTHLPWSQEMKLAKLAVDTKKVAATPRCDGNLCVVLAALVRNTYLYFYLISIANVGWI